MKKMIFILFIISNLLFSQEKQTRRFLIEVNDIDSIEFKALGISYNDYSFEKVLKYYDKKLVLLASESEINLYRDKGFVVNILMQDTSRITLLKRAYFGESLKFPDCYHTYDEIINIVDSLSKKFPKLVRKISIGKTTTNNRTIFAVKVSNNVSIDQDKPGILINGCHHSDEILGAEICIELIKYLIDNYSKDIEVTDWINNYEIYIIPVVNVDGHYVVTANHNPIWRKNTRDINKNGIIDENDGVDLNRNYDFNWAFGGSGDIGSERYRGEYPFSESENRAVKNLLDKKKFILSISYHSQGEVIYYPWNWYGRKTPDDSLLTEIANGLASSIKTYDGKSFYKAEYGAGTVGQTFTYFYGKYGIFDFVVETGKGTHIYPCEGREKIIKSNLEGVKFIFRRGKGPGLTGKIKDARNGKYLNAIIWIPAIESEEIARRTSDNKFGRYFRLLKPERKYDIFFIKEGYETKIVKGVSINKNGWTTLNVELNPLKK